MIEFRAYGDGTFWYSDKFLHFSTEYRTCDIKNAPFKIEDLEQYTGINDKNGVKIFKGDIVIAKSCVASDYSAEPSTYVIGFQDGAFIFESRSFPVKQWDDGSHNWYSIENVETFEIEVVGNVHTNKGEY